MNLIERQNGLLIYKDKDRNVVADAIYRDETLWLTQKGMAKVFGCWQNCHSKTFKKHIYWWRIE